MIAFCTRFITMSTPAVPRQRPVAGSLRGSAAASAQRKRSARSPCNAMVWMVKHGDSSAGRWPRSSVEGCSRTSGVDSCCSRNARSRSCCRSNSCSGDTACAQAGACTPAMASATPTDNRHRNVRLRT
ncbi:hypothetical protein G6F22_020800 [Rhizopus arrhizus]|nr:hypothetical protein G6F22_020800 [Rhizopus arrhizus]KAG1224992.1 hypothetical protein G6F68_020016 [Rhizopus microsporus]